MVLARVEYGQARRRQPNSAVFEVLGDDEQDQGDAQDLKPGSDQMSTKVPDTGALDIDLAGIDVAGEAGELREAHGRGRPESERQDRDKRDGGGPPGPVSGSSERLGTRVAVCHEECEVVSEGEDDEAQGACPRAISPVRSAHRGTVRETA